MPAGTSPAPLDTDPAGPATGDATAATPLAAFLVRADPAVKSAAEQLAAAGGESLSALVDRLLRGHVAEGQGTVPPLWSLVEIAAALGVTRSAVHQRLVAVPPVVPGAGSRPARYAPATVRAALGLADSFEVR